MLQQFKYAVVYLAFATATANVACLAVASATANAGELLFLILSILKRV